MRLLLLSFILLSTVACVGTGKRTPIPVITDQSGLKTEVKDLPKIEVSASALLVTREAGSFELSSLYLTEYLKSKTLPSLQLFNNDEIIGEISAEDQAKFTFIPAATTLAVTDEEIATGEDHGNAIASGQFAVGQVWMLEKMGSTASYTIIFKITDYRAGKSIKLSYKLKEFNYL